jgi:GT2 family glycosyltransferase
MTICEECNEPFKLRNSKGSVWRRLCACGDLADFEPAHRATIIVPSRFPDIFEDCRDSINKFAPKENKILVRDGNSIAAPEGWQTIQGPDAKFVYSRNINLGIAASTGDVLLTNDDVRFMHPNTLEIMQNVMARNPEVGILSPLIKGDVGEYWQSHATKIYITPKFDSASCAFSFDEKRWTKSDCSTKDSPGTATTTVITAAAS